MMGRQQFSFPRMPGPPLKSDKVALVARGKVRQRSVGVDSWKSDRHVLG